MLSVESANERGAGRFPGLLGLQFVEVEPGRIVCEMRVRPELLAPNGFLHAATVVGIADTACGYGTFNSLPEGASNFTTIELKSNFLGTAREGLVRATATRVHAGRSTQVWDAEVVNADTDRRIALFRCTNMVLYPK